MACDSIEDWLKAGFESAFPGNDFSGVRALPATDAKFGDFQCNDALAAAKTLHMPPRKIAEAVFARLEADRPPFVAKLELAGPGFLNITVSPDWIAARLAALAADPHAGVPQSGAGKRVVIDYSSPNAAKQMHIGHIRSTVIGNAIDRIYRALGYDVVADNHLGDWGTQFGILIKGYRELLTQEERDNLTVANLEKCYVLSAAKAKEEDGVWKEACKAELVKLQQGDAGNLALWKRFIDISIGEFDRMYAKLGVKFDTYRGESYYNGTMPGVVAKLQEMGLAVESEGALIVNLEAEKLGVAIVRKSDGGYNYTTSDLACVKSRVEEYSPERIIYVTDARQQLHFKQWFSIAAKMGYSGVKLVHVPFGLMSFQGKAISTREGNLIKLDELLAEAKRRAYDIVKDRGGDEKLAEQIGYGAVQLGQGARARGQLRSVPPVRLRARVFAPRQGGQSRPFRCRVQLFRARRAAARAPAPAVRPHGAARGGELQAVRPRRLPLPDGAALQLVLPAFADPQERAGGARRAPAPLRALRHGPLHGPPPPRHRNALPHLGRTFRFAAGAFCGIIFPSSFKQGV